MEGLFCFLLVYERSRAFSPLRCGNKPEGGQAVGEGPPCCGLGLESRSEAWGRTVDPCRIDRFDSVTWKVSKWEIYLLLGFLTVSVPRAPLAVWGAVESLLRIILLNA